MSCIQRPLFRLPAVDGARAAAPVEGDPSGLLWCNPLRAPIFVSFSGSTPSRSSYDLVIPGESLGSWPLGPIARVGAVVDYPGAVPSADANLEAILSVTNAGVGVHVGPLA